MPVRSDTTKSSASPKKWQPPKSLHVEPSYIGSDARYNVFDGDGMISTHNDGERRQLAAFLQAAPEMLDALKMALRNEEARLYMLPASDDYDVSCQKDILSAAIGRYRAAISKAEGQQ